MQVNTSTVDSRSGWVYFWFPGSMRIELFHPYYYKGNIWKNLFEKISKKVLTHPRTRDTIIERFARAGHGRTLKIE